MYVAIYVVLIVVLTLLMKNASVIRVLQKNNANSCHINTLDCLKYTNHKMSGGIIVIFRKNDVLVF